MKKNDTLLIGFMLFALFFGAGNLIYPPFLGKEAGSSFWMAISGFIITGVGLPILAVAAIALAKGGVNSLGSRVHPLFGMVFSTIVYLTIGPFFGIPRGANVAYEMGVKPFTSGTAWNETVVLLLFSLAFFAFVYIVSLNPSKMVDQIGMWLTPILLLAIAALVVFSFIRLDSPIQAATAKYQANPFFTGFLEGYQTMDTIAALAFGIIVVSAFQDRGIQDQKIVLKQTLKSGIIAGGALALVYVSLGLMGAKIASLSSFENGTAILNFAADHLFGTSGKLLLGLIVALACFTTCVGLITACGQYFSQTFPWLSYKSWITAITVVSFLIANLGLNQIISISVPVLVAVYPLTIVLVILSFFDRQFGGSRFVYGGAMLLTGLLAIYDTIKMLGYAPASLQALVDLLPFSSIGLGWVIPSIAGGAVGWIISKRNKSTSLDGNLKKAS